MLRSTISCPAGSRSRTFPSIRAGLPLQDARNPSAGDRVRRCDCGPDGAYSRGCRYLADRRDRASLSIDANIAESNGRLTRADRKHCFGIARGSTQKCVPMLKLASRRQLVEPGRRAALREAPETTARMISGLIRGLEQRAS
ncbi:MAG: four helix bundle protein [Planctomycetota bacterium]|nr:four helix bundle protein [Planctomycetota bacterium]